MVYSIQGETIRTWFAGFNRNSDWQLHLCKGANRADVEAVLNSK
jgi:hypothetical protein